MHLKPSSSWMAFNIRLKLAVLHRCSFWASRVTLWVLCMWGSPVCAISCTWILTVYNIRVSHCTCLCLSRCHCMSALTFWCAAGCRQERDAGLINLNVNTTIVNYPWCSATINPSNIYSLLWYSWHIHLNQSQSVCSHLKYKGVISFPSGSAQLNHRQQKR